MSKKKTSSSKETAPAVSSCPRCQNSVPAEVKFCGGCGWDLSKEFVRYSFRSRDVLTLVLVAAALWGGSASLSAMKAGVKPTVAYTPEKPAAVESEFADDEQLTALRAAHEKSPTDIKALRDLLEELLNRVRTTERPSSKFLFEVMDILGKLLQLDPNDAQALLAMADISFNQQVFDKSLSYYERYLKLAPSDYAVRSRYASSLTFVGKATEAIRELTVALKGDPNNFHTLAYLAIANAQLQQNDQAIKIGEQALAHAPSDEARQRFTEFLDAVRGGKNMALPQTQSARGNSAAQSTNSTQDFAALANSVGSNPVAGPKYQGFDIVGTNTLRLYFNDFPMDKMPPFALEKFFAGIKAKAEELKLSSLKHVLFVDKSTGQEMQRIDR